MQRKDWWWVGSMTALFTLVIGGLQWWKWQLFGYNGLDLGIYHQVVWGLSHGQGFISSVHDPSYLGDHLELWLVPLAGVYKLWPSALTLLWTQTLVLASSVLPLVLIARQLVGRIPALVAAGLWLAHPFVYNAAMYEFHGLVFALPLLLWSIWAYQSRRLGWWVILLLLLLAVREDLPLLVAGWSVFAAIERRSWRWWAPALVLAAGWWWFAQHVITAHQPLGSYKYLAFYQWLGDNPVDILTFPFRHPVIFLSHLFQARNWVTTLGFFIGFGFLPFLRPKYLIPAGLAWLQLMLLGAEADSVLRLHYVIQYLPWLAWATLIVIRDYRAGSLRVPFRAVGLAVIPVIAVVGPVYTHALYGPAEWPWTTRTDPGFTNPAVLRWGIQQVPEQASVLTTFNLLPQLANREHIYSLNYVYLGRRQYTETRYDVPAPIDVALIDWQQFYHYQFLYRTTKFENRTGPQRLKDLLADNQLQLTAWVDNLAIYTRQGNDPYQPTQSFPQTNTDTENFQLLGTPTVDVAPNPMGGNQIEIGFRWNHPTTLTRPYSVRLIGRNQNQIVWQETRLLGQGWQPSDSWEAQQVWETRYRLVLPPNLPANLDWSAEIVALDGRVRLDRIRRFSPVLKHSEEITSISIGPLGS